MRYLIGWLDSGLPGYRSLTIGGTGHTIPDAYQRVTEAVDALSSELAASGWSAEVLANGRVRLTGSSADLTWPDRLGWLLGFETEPGDSDTGKTSLTSSSVPPGIVPLYGADVEAVDLTQEEDLSVDRHLRGHGYVWGGAAVWRVRAMASAEAVRALKAGWVLRGKVTLSPTLHPATAGAWDAETNPGGYLDGHVMGLESLTWRGDARLVADLTLLLVREPA